MKRLVLLGVLGAVLAGCATAPPVPRPATAADSAPDTSAPDTGAERALPVYYVAQTAAGPRLQREFHRLAAADPASAAVRDMLAHPTGVDPDYRNPWPAGTALRAPVTSTADVITVDLTAASRRRSDTRGFSSQYPQPYVFIWDSQKDPEGFSSFDFQRTRRSFPV